MKSSTPVRPQFKLWLLGIYLIPAIIIGRYGGIGDIRIYWEAALASCQGNLNQIYNVSVEVYNQALAQPFWYPPVFLQLISPLCLIGDYSTLVIASLTLHVSCYLAFWFFLHQLFPVLKERNCLLGWMVVWIVAINPMHCNFQAQNIQLPLITALLAGEWIRQKHPNHAFWAGLLVALASVVKVYPGIVAVFYLLTKNNRVKLGLIAGGALSLLLPTLAYGWADAIRMHQGFFAIISTYGDIVDPVREPSVMSLLTFIAHWLAPITTKAQRSLAMFATQISLAAAFFVFAFRHRKENAEFENHIWALACALCVFLSPSSRHDYFLFYIPAFASLVTLAREPLARWIPKWSLTIGSILLALTTSFLLGRQLNDTVELMRIPVIGMLAVTLGLFLILRRWAKA